MRRVRKKGGGERHLLFNRSLWCVAEDETASSRFGHVGVDGDVSKGACVGGAEPLEGGENLNEPSADSLAKALKH